MELTQAQPQLRFGSVFRTVGVAIALAAAIAISVVGVMRTSSLSTKIGRLSTQMAAVHKTNAELQTKVSRQNGASTQDVSALSASVSKLKARVKLYDTCVPEIMGQIDNLTGDVTGTGTLYVSPTQNVSQYCQPVLYGASSGPGTGD